MEKTVNFQMIGKRRAGPLTAWRKAATVRRQKAQARETQALLLKNEMIGSLRTEDIPQDVQINLRKDAVVPDRNLEIVTLAIDMKVPADGKIQILEVMPAHHAGSSGYYSVMKQSMLYDVILPDLARAFPGHVVAGKPFGTRMDDIGEYFARGAARAGGGIIFPGYDEQGRKYYEPLLRTELLFCADHPEYRTVNADVTLIAGCENKALQHFVAEQHAVTRAAFAPAIVLPTAYSPDLAAQIEQALGRHDHYVIKPVAESQGNGVRVVPHGRLQGHLVAQLVSHHAGVEPLPGIDYWDTDIAPVFVAQPLISSAPLPIHDASGQPQGKARYDGTLRVFLTLHRTDPQADYETLVHDGYWKLPAAPVRRKKDIESIVSFSPARLERGLFARTFDRSAIISSAMTDAQRAAIFPQVAQSMAVFTRNLLSRTLYDYIDTGLKANDPAQKGTALMLACDSRYHVNTREAPVTRDREQMPDDFLMAMTQILAFGDPENPGTRYLTKLWEQPVRPVPPAWRAVMTPAVRIAQDRNPKPYDQP